MPSSTAWPTAFALFLTTHCTGWGWLCQTAGEEILQKDDCAHIIQKGSVEMCPQIPMFIFSFKGLALKAIFLFYVWALMGPYSLAHTRLSAKQKDTPKAWESRS